MIFFRVVFAIAGTLFVIALMFLLLPPIFMFIRLQSFDFLEYLGDKYDDYLEYWYNKFDGDCG